MKTITAVFFVLLTFPNLLHAMPALISADWLAKNMEGKDYYFIEVISRSNHENEIDLHVRGAVKTVYADDGWVDDFSQLPNTLADFDELKEVAANIGVSYRKHTVLVSMKNDIYSIASTIRVYWALKMLGVQNLSVLDGGFAAYKAKDLPTSKRVTKPIRKLFKANIDDSYLATNDDVMNVIKTYQTLIDARLPSFFIGENKHVYSDIRGSISGADNVPWSSLLNEDGTFKNKITLWNIFAQYLHSSSNTHVVYSDTGHVAAIAWFVLSELIDLENVKLYDEGYVMWQSIPNNPIQYLNDELGSSFGLVY